ncbi:MAG: T9SS type A sorting domain-containing protein, partial [Sphingobacteriales bacterium]
TIYYRIKQSDIDGKSTYSPVRSVKLSQKQNLIQVNPNPFVDNITVKYMSEVSGVMDIKVINANGQTMVAKKNTLSKGFNNVAVYNLGSLPKGLYIAEVMINGELSERTKLMKN